MGTRGAEEQTRKEMDWWRCVARLEAPDNETVSVGDSRRAHDATHTAAFLRRPFSNLFLKILAQSPVTHERVAQRRRRRAARFESNAARTQRSGRGAVAGQHVRAELVVHERAELAVEDDVAIHGAVLLDSPHEDLRPRVAEAVAQQRRPRRRIRCGFDPRGQRTSRASFLQRSWT